MLSRRVAGGKVSYFLNNVNKAAFLFRTERAIPQIAYGFAYFCIAFLKKRGLESLDKTLRGPFGGMILCRQELATSIDKAVHPGTQSSFSVRKIADAANALLLTESEDFKEYARNVLVNAKTLERGFSHLQDALLSGGTDKHYVVLDVRKAFGLTGVESEKLLEEIDILSSRQTLPTDPSARMTETNGLRLGTAWATSRGYLAPDFREIAEVVCEALASAGNKSTLMELSKRVSGLVGQTRSRDVWGPS